MNSNKQTFSQIIFTNRYGLLLFITLCMITAAVLAMSEPLNKVVGNDSKVIVNTRLSQNKVVQGEISTVYLDVDVRPPSINDDGDTNKASDIVVVLDRSGSMSEANKMTYAKSAIKELLSRLDQNDRFALVSFANNANMHSDLVTVDDRQKLTLSSMLNHIQPAGGTNMSAGLQQAVQILSRHDTSRAAKVLLLSDGHANQGITNPNGLKKIVNHLTRKESVLSSIGLGLEFNETLLSSLADHGMGTYTYLENLSGLGDIFNQYLNSTRQIFAAGSTMNLLLNEGIELVDAAGYPINRQADGSVTIATGQLLNGTDKNFVMTFNVHAQHTGAVAIGEMSFNYKVNGKTYQQSIVNEQLALAVVHPQRRDEAVSSIDRDVYKQSWLENNLGVVQKKVSHWIRKGDKDKAKEEINEYRSKLSQAEKQAAMPLVSEEVDSRLAEMEVGVAKAFSGSLADQKVNRQREAKNMQLESLKKQRVLSKQ